MNQGKYIVIEGAYGVGKTTQAEQLIAKLQSEGIEAVYVQEPGGSAFAQKLRELIKHGPERSSTANVLAFNAARAETMQEVRQHIHAGRWVVADRSFVSTIVYQGYGEGRDIERIRSVCRFALDGVEPDAVFILTAPTDTVAARMTENENADYFEDMASQFHDRVREGYLLEARKNDYQVVDASQPLDKVSSHIYKHIEQLKTENHYFVPRTLDEKTKARFESTLDDISKLREQIKSALNDHARLYELSNPNTQVNDAINRLKPLASIPSAKNLLQEIVVNESLNGYSMTAEPVQLIDVSLRNEFELLPHLLYKQTELSHYEISKEVEKWDYKKKLMTLKKSLKSKDKSLRNGLEYAHYTFDILWELQDVINFLRYSPTKQAVAQRFTPRHGYDVPQIVEDAGVADEYEDCFDKSYELYSRLQALGKYQEAQLATLMGHKVRCKLTLTPHMLTKAAAQKLIEPRSRQLWSKVHEVHPTLAEYMSPFA